MGPFHTAGFCDLPQSWLQPGQELMLLLALQGGGFAAEVSWVRSWKRVLAGIGVTVSGLERNLAMRRCLQQRRGPGEKLPRLGEKVVTGWPVPQFVSLFLPEFPIRPPLGQPQLKILGFVAKGSFGTVLKVLDCRREKVFAVKVVPKVEVLRRDTLKQCKEEVSIQRQVSHPFVHCLGDSWQGQRHLFIMCTYCSTGDLHTLWASSGRFAEATIRLFAAELVLALGYLHDLGIVHRDVKMENILLDERGHLKLTDFGLSRHLRRGERAYTICGTLQYMAPEVLSGGPYSHSADWWSLGILLFTLATGKFPVPPERDHLAMLASVNRCSYESPGSLSRGLSLLLSELLCRNPLRRLRYLHHFKSHLFFRGVTFDAELLQKQPVDVVVAARQAEAAALESSVTFTDFDCDLLAWLRQS
ncbi:ribosomal protein S6 kinase-related protein isoform X1 [Chrysemys picta bellii]|uniref:ribosomal protein S6 kinase-related protein isoform X1 n=1 Tax=Chrysemys picta bellii TaxID=8478 RepID=UPI0032B1975B